MTGHDELVDHKITYEWLSADQMTIDPRVQRNIDARRVRKIADAFDPSALGTLTVSQRDDGTYVLLNGQHRKAAGQQSGYTGRFHCEVHHGISLQDEAHLFLTLNEQLTPSAVSKFLVRVTEGDPVALAIEAILSTYGWCVGIGTVPGYLNAVTAIENVYRTAGGTKPRGEYPDITESTIALATRAWGTDPKAVSRVLLLGIGQLLGRFGPAVNIDKLARDLQMTTPAAVTALGKVLQSAQGGTTQAAVAKTLVGLHNKKLRTKLLPEWVWTR